MSARRPFLSVVVPAHQGAGVLPQALQALRASDLCGECWELIVVDDASTDRTALVAAQFADTVVRLAGNRHGPAYARNRGVEASRGDVIVFVDADVCVHRDTLRRFATLFAERPEISAAFGSYDTRPTGSGLVSQYRNLLHHYVHLRGAGEAETFWAGCGAIRHAVFASVGGFDEWHYVRPQIEDIELGRRVRLAGHRIVLDPKIQSTHLKRWTLRDVLTTDLARRGVPWMWLMIQEGRSATSTLSVRSPERWCTALMWAAVLGALGAVLWPTRVPLAGAGAAAALVLLLNHGFYRFLKRERGLAFALAVVPLHGLYYLSNGVSVFGGWLLHTLFGEPQLPASAAALAGLDLKTWPPAPARPSVSVWNPPLPRGVPEAGSP
jgi:GT2 family glycosyltransferase